MKIVIQRVKNASVTVDGQVIGEIGKGFLLLVGVSQTDTEAVADKMVDQGTASCGFLRMSRRKTNLSLADVKGELLVVSQFTLYADEKGQPPQLYLRRSSGAGQPAL